MQNIKESKEVTKCFCCGGTILKHIKIDNIDETAEWTQFITGYVCKDCLRVNHKDEVEESFSYTVSVDVPIIQEDATDTKNWWPASMEIR